MIKPIVIKTALSCLLFALFSCSSSDDDTDTEKPTISINYEQGFPQSCTIIKKGEGFNIRVKTSDNLGLASYAIDIHNNFDHHTHDDQGSSCAMDGEKEPVKPLIYMKSFDINGSPKSYEIEQLINIPDDIDSGDYHCQISIIDVTGWQSRTSVDIKIE